MSNSETIFVINRHFHYFSFEYGLLDVSKLLRKGCIVTNKFSTFKEKLMATMGELEEENIMPTTFVLEEHKGQFGLWDDRGFFNSLEDELRKSNSKESLIAKLAI